MQFSPCGIAEKASTNTLDREAHRRLSPQRTSHGLYTRPIPEEPTPLLRATSAWQQLRDQRLPREMDARKWDAAVTELEVATLGLASTEVEAEAARATLREALRRAKAAEAVAAVQRPRYGTDEGQLIEGRLLVTGFSANGVSAEQHEVEMVRLVHTAASSLTSVMSARAARAEAAHLKEQLEREELVERQQKEQLVEQLQKEQLVDQQQKKQLEEQLQSSELKVKLLQREQLQREQLQREHIPAAHTPPVHMPAVSWPCGSVGSDGALPAAPAEMVEGCSGASTAGASVCSPRATGSSTGVLITDEDANYELVRAQTAVPRLAATRLQASWRGAKARRIAARCSCSKCAAQMRTLDFSLADPPDLPEAQGGHEGNAC